MLSGDNGILQKATTAKENTDSSQIQERINLAYHSSLVEGQGKVTEPSLESELKKEFNKDTLDDGWLDKTSVAEKWKITIDGVSLEVPAGEKVADKTTIKVGTTNLKDVSDLSTLYGETTDYISVSNVQWQLFYDDNGYIYLIASDYVPNSLLSSELIKSRNTKNNYKDYCAYFQEYDYSSSSYKGVIIESLPWIKGIESNTIISNSQTSTYLRWVNSSLVTTKDNPNMKAVAYMMDVSKWNQFAGNADGAYAIGGPTLEMFVKSYNAKHSTSQLGEYDSIDLNNASQYGYKVKIGTGNWSDSIMGGFSDNSDNMWVKTGNDKASGYWLSSPESQYDNGLRGIGKESGFFFATSGLMSSDFNGFRPLVAIPKSSLK